MPETCQYEMVRRWFTERTTISEVKLLGQHELFVLEDRDRPDGPKVSKQTCIPAGRYRITRTKSARFGYVMPIIWNVALPDGRLLVRGEGKEFEGIRVHTGNTHLHTEGCLITGRQRGLDVKTGDGIVYESQAAYDIFDAKIEASISRGVEVWLNITRAPESERAVC